MLAHHRVVALGQLADEIVCAGQLRGSQHGLDRRGRVDDGDVLAHAAVEQQVVLQHHADLAAQLGRIDQPDIDAVDQDAALFRRVQPLYQLRQRAFARTRSPDDADHLAGADVEAEALQSRCSLRSVAEGHLIERDLATDGWQLRCMAGRHFGACVQHIAKARHRDASLLEITPHLRNAHDGLADTAGEHVEGDEHAHGQLPFNHEVRAVPERGSVHQLADQVHAFMPNAGQRLRSKAGRYISRELVVPTSRHRGFERGGLHRLYAGHGLDQQGLVLCSAREFLVEPGTQDGHHHPTQRQVQRNGGQHDQRQRHAVGEHHRDEDDREQHVQHQRQRVASEKAADVFQLAHASDRIADAARLEVGQRQVQQVPKQPRAQFDIDATGGVAEDVGAQRGEYALEHHHDDQSDHQDVKGRQATVHQHLVHHHLKEQRTDQGEQLQEQADGEHFADQAAVLDEAGDEPAEIELRQFASERGAAGDQNQLTGPLGGEDVDRLDRRPRPV